MKKILKCLVLLAVLLGIITAFSITTSAASSGSCGTNVRWTLSSDGTLTISGTGAMTDYTSSSSMPWYNLKASIKKVVVKKGVTSIGNGAFYDCDALTSITIPDSVTSIGSFAFYDCSSLTSITIPDSVTSIGNSAFFYCSALESVTIGNGVTSIGEEAFSYCSSLTSITIPDSVTTIDDWAFIGCSALTSVTIGNSVTSIGNYAFEGCSSLTSITIPDSVTSIGDSAFSGCSENIIIRFLGTPARWDEIKGNSVPASAKVVFGYLIFYNANGGIGFMSEQFISSGNTPTLTPNQFVKTGYTFLGWSTTHEGDLLYMDEDTLSNTQEENTTLYAVWKPIRYKVAFNANGGTGTMPTVTYTYDVEKTLSTNIFHNSGYNFIGWSDKADGEVLYADDASVKNLTAVANETVTLYAVWEKRAYNVQYSANGGVGTMSDSVMPMDVPNALAPNTFSRTGYVFVGWSDDAKGEVVYSEKQEVTNLTEEQNGTVVLYAVWKPITYTVSYHSNGGKGSMADSSYKYDEKATLAENAFRKSGFAFMGWALSENGDVVYQDKAEILNLTNVDGKTIELFAIWRDASIKDEGVCGDDLSWVLNYDGKLTISGEGEIPNYSTGLAPWAKGATWALRDDGTLTIAGRGSMMDYDVSGDVPWYSLRGKLTNVVVEQGITTIGTRAFISCSKITNVTIPDSVTSIEPYAFYGCSGITSIVIPETVTYIGSSTFTNCNSLQTIYFTGTEAQWNAIPKNDSKIPSTTTIVFEYEIPTDGSTNTGSNSGTITNSGVCGEDTDIKEIIIGEGVTAIGNSAFKGCVGLQKVRIPYTVETIYKDAFYGCSNLADVYYASNEDDWDYITVFAGNIALTDANVVFNAKYFKLDAVEESGVLKVKVSGVNLPAGTVYYGTTCDENGKALEIKPLVLNVETNFDVEEVNDVKVFAWGENFAPVIESITKTVVE